MMVSKTVTTMRMGLRMRATVIVVMEMLVMMMAASYGHDGGGMLSL